MSNVLTDSAEEVAIRNQLISDPALFVAYYSDFVLEDFHVTFLRAMAKHQRLVALLPRGHGKTSLTTFYIIWRICQNPNVRIILIAKNDREASMYSRQIRTELTSNIKLIQDWGPFKPTNKEAVWGNDSFMVKRRQINDIRPTCLLVGSKSTEQVLGSRCDELIADDIVTPETTSTPEQREKQSSIFNLGAQTCPQYMWPTKNGILQVPDGIFWPKDVEYESVKLLGTVFHPDDLFHRKAGRIDRLSPFKVHTSKVDPTYKVIYFDCWRDKECTEPLWPGYWDADKLHAEEKSVGTIDFNRRYRNIAIDEGSLVFRKVWVYGGDYHGVKYPGCLDYTRSFGEFVNAKKPYIVMGFDPSTGRSGKGTTFSSFVVIGVDKSEEPMKRYLIDIRRGQWGFDDILSNMIDGDQPRSISGLHTEYHYDEGRVETNAAQKWLLDNKRVQTAMMRGVRLVPHETQKGNKHDPVMGVASMQEMVKNGWLRIPYKNPSDRELAREFIEQLLLFPEGVHDYCMAAWFAELAFRDLGSKYQAWSGSKSRGFTVTNPFFAR